MKINDKNFEIFIPHNKIISRIQKIGKEINKEYANSNPLFIAILNGSFMFAADLMKAITVKSEISFVKVSSYQATKSTGNIKEMIGLQENIFKRDIIILEDIVDTGHTLSFLIKNFQALGPKSIEIATLLHKPDTTIVELPIKYVGFSIPNHFVIGYGLDIDGIGRNNKDIYQLRE